MVIKQNLVIQKAQKGSNIVIFNSDLRRFFKIQKRNIGEQKALNYLIHTEQQNICLLKSFDDKDEIEKMIYFQQVLNQEFYVGLSKSIRH